MSELDEVPTVSELTKQDKFDIAVLDLTARADALVRIAQHKGSEPDDQAESLTHADAVVSINRPLGREPEVFQSLIAKCDTLYATEQFDECFDTCPGPRPRSISRTNGNGQQSQSSNSASRGSPPRRCSVIGYRNGLSCSLILGQVWNRQGLIGG